MRLPVKEKKKEQKETEVVDKATKQKLAASSIDFEVKKKAFVKSDKKKK